MTSGDALDRVLGGGHYCECRAEVGDGKIRVWPCSAEHGAQWLEALPRLMVDLGYSMPVELVEPSCADCGEPGEVAGHMGCQYPRDRDEVEPDELPAP